MIDKRSLAKKAIADLAEGLIALVGPQADRDESAASSRVVAAITQELRLLAAAPRLVAPLGPGVELPVCRHLAWALGQARGEASCFVASLERLLPVLCWTQNPSYRREPPSAGFLDRYGYAVVAGPENGARALARHPHLAFGLLLLGPQTTYPAHEHPASEIYVPLGPAEWMMGEEPFAPREAGAVIVHNPGIVHATRTGSAPLAALYLWAGDLATHARIVGGASEPMARNGRNV
jgi:hypothetical protein